MDEQGLARMEEKYGGRTAVKEKRQMDVGRAAGRTRALASGGKPKNLKASVSRLLG